MKSRNELAIELTKAIESNDTNSLYGVVRELLSNDESKALETHYAEALKNYETLTSNDDESYDETLERKYEEGFSDALAMALRVLDGKAN